MYCYSHNGSANKLQLLLALILAVVFICSCGDDNANSVDGDLESAEMDMDQDDGEDELTEQPIDGDSDDEISENGEDDAEAIEDEEESVEEITRTLIENSDGYCRTSGDVPVTCSTVEDCRAYRTPISVDFDCDTLAASLFDCALATASEFPTEYDSTCSADARCDYMPVACEDGQCVKNLPDDSCVTDSDCTMIDAGCYCFPANTTVTGYDAGFGSECDALSSCPDNSTSICISGVCRIVGDHLDDLIDAACSEFVEWKFIAYDNKSECITDFSQNNYQAIPGMLSTLEVAVEFSNFSDHYAFFGGPWHGMVGICSPM